MIHFKTDIMIHSIAYASWAQWEKKKRLPAKLTVSQLMGLTDHNSLLIFFVIKTMLTTL